MREGTRGAVSLAFLRGERRLKRFKRVDLQGLSRDQKIKVGEMARRTGLSFQECAARVVSGQKTLTETEE